MAEEALPEEAERVRPLFTVEDEILLLQLQAKKAIVERAPRSKAKDTGTQDGDGDGEENGEDAKVIPWQWRLLPEDITLHAWQQECLPLWLKDGRGTVKVATGGGKTTFALAAAQALQNDRERELRLVIVAPTIPLMFQWYDELIGGNLPSSAIGLMGGGQDLPPLSSLRVLICVLNSARERLPDLVKKADWSEHMLLVVDECHRSGAEQARRIFDSEPKYTLGLSATPERDDDGGGEPGNAAYDRGVVGLALGPVIFELSLRQSLDAGLLTPFEVWHVGLPLTPSEASTHARLSREITELRQPLQALHRSSRSKQDFLQWCQTQAKRGGDVGANADRFLGLANRRKRLLYSAKARGVVTLAALTESLSEPDGRAIVFHESIADIEAIFLLAIDRGIPAVLEHSQLPDALRNASIDAFRRGVARVIISAKSLVEGFNVPSADLGVIAASSSSVRQRIQSLGRMLRRKPGGRPARVIVLYVSKTEDEAIYGQADWERIIGAERNRYFVLNNADEGLVWPDALIKTCSPPRRYRPPDDEVDLEGLPCGGVYPGQVIGADLTVDQDETLRSDAGDRVPAQREWVEAILRFNPSRRARVTPTAGHLIVRASAAIDEDDAWRFIGVITWPVDSPEPQPVQLRLKTRSGCRVIEGSPTKNKKYPPTAIGPAAVIRRLFDWIGEQERQRGRKIHYLYWDGSERYWLEVEGDQISFDELLAPLEFPT